LAKQINPEVLCLVNELLIDPDFAMVIILPGDGIIPQQKTAPHRTIHYMNNRNLIRRKDLNPSQPSHDSPRATNPSTICRAEIYRLKSRQSTKCCVPKIPDIRPEGQLQAKKTVV